MMCLSKSQEDDIMNCRNHKMMLMVMCRLKSPDENVRAKLLVFSTDTSSWSILLCVRKKHPDAVTLMRWRIACPTPFNAAWCDAL